MATTPTSPERQAGLRLRAWLKLQQPPRPAEIADRAGVSRQYVDHVLAGRVRPSERIIAACEELGIPVELIFGQSPEMRVPALAGTSGTRDDTDDDESSATGP